MGYNSPQTIVICGRCLSDCPPIGYDARFNVFKYDYSQPCQKCGATEWCAHDVRRDRKTGRLLAESERA